MLQSLRGIIFQVDLLNPVMLFRAVLLDLVMTQSLLETLVVEGLMLIGSLVAAGRSKIMRTITKLGSMCCQVSQGRYDDGV
jgi:hypothetical protein